MDNNNNIFITGTNKFKNIVMPILAIIVSLFMIFAAIYSHGIIPYLTAKEEREFSFPVIFYLIVYVVIMIIGIFFYNQKKHKI